MIRIGIDARFLTHPQWGGFKTYTENLVGALAAIDTENEYVLYVDRTPDAQTALPRRPNFRVRRVPGTLPVIGMPWREQVGLALQARRDRVDMLHAPCLTAPLRLSCPLVVTIHDMIWFFADRFAQGKTSSGKRKLMQWYYHAVPQAAARNAAAVITVSHAAKQSIVEHLGLSPERITVTHGAASPIYRRIDDPARLAGIRQKYGLEPAYILAVGSADPRKNIPTLLRAYAHLPASVRAAHPLAIVWTHNLLAGDLARQAEELGISGRLRFLERVSNEDLVLLYNAAALFVFPSRYEGFGLPPLEAMHCGTPVVAANNSSIPEIVGEAALLTDAEDAQAIASSIGRVLTDDALRATLIARGLERAAGFSWEKCARETLHVYRAVAGLPAPYAQNVTLHPRSK